MMFCGWEWLELIGLRIFASIARMLFLFSLSAWLQASDCFVFFLLSSNFYFLVFCCCSLLCIPISVLFLSFFLCIFISLFAQFPRTFPQDETLVFDALFSQSFSPHFDVND